jgi:hypothetical protein
VTGKRGGRGGIVLVAALAALAVGVLLGFWALGGKDTEEGSPELAPVTEFAQVCDPEVAERVPPARSVTYTAETGAEVSHDAAAFVRGVDAILAHPCGWARAGVEFVRVDRDPEMQLLLATPDQVAAAAEGCSEEYSCRVDSRVLINDARWRDATGPWRDEGLGLGAYRHMAVNHEVGHYLGLEHVECGTPGGPAPLMQQQSKGLDGCTFNPWPLPEELEAVA